MRVGQFHRQVSGSEEIQGNENSEKTMSHQDQEQFERQLEVLIRNFELGARSAESDDDIANAMLAFVLERERQRHGVTNKPRATAAVDIATLEKISNWDSDDPSMSAIEKFLKKLSSGDGARAVLYLKRNIYNKLTAATEEQRRKAKLPRSKHPIDELIDDIVTQNPAISGHRLLIELRKMIGKGVIELIDDTHIEVASGAPDIKISGLKDRLTRAKKKLSR